MALCLGLQIIAPATVSLGSQTATFTALLLQFGGKNGMIVDPDWMTISPLADALVRLGYGYSVVELDHITDDDGPQKMLRDWGWTAAEAKPSWW